MGLQASVIRDILQAASSQGAAYDTLCALTGFKQEELNDSSVMLEWEKSACIWDVLQAVSGDELIGLHMADGVSLSICGMVGFLLRSSTTLDEAFSLYIRYGHMVCPMVAFSRTDSTDATTIRLEQNAMWLNKYPENARQAMDFTIAGVVNHTSELAGTRITPLSISLNYGKRNVAEYERLLGCRVLFNQPEVCVVFRKEDLSRPIITRDVSLFALFSDILEQKMTAYLETSTGDALKQIMMMRFRGRIPTIEEAAQEMELTPRVLQRKLADEGTSFRVIAAEVRKEIARHLMQRPGSSLTEVAQILGYGDLTAFRRAYKSWTSETPKEARKKLRQTMQPA